MAAPSRIRSHIILGMYLLLLTCVGAVFLRAKPRSESSYNFSQIKVEYARVHPEKMLGSSANTSKWALALMEAMSCFITSRHPRLVNFVLKTCQADTCSHHWLPH